eukprot:gnl/MRDRNA2_/MRDRNA2_87032_c0_seq1.p1 gnl/MRDRNA2_/MRDRNA2_87032_c0~~gnl/MRDRNA2_/MRDRNA2_87032_c0_seq1.p1  ORF type:complete len:106 (+),score=23.49 gnl/MRDRNA2_/MRDRNA2_87032_c0_seq1:84-401(+)
MQAIGQMVSAAHAAVVMPRATSGGMCNIIKLGTFCRTVVWPVFPPLMLYQYIRQTDKDMFAVELLYYKSGSKDSKAFYDSSKPGISGHWRIQQDLETIRAAANAE